MTEYVIDGYVFTSKVALGDAIRSILNNYEPGQELAQVDADFMEDVLDMHPHAAEKKGAGVKAFCVETNPSFKNKQFAVIRRDGTRTDFSFNKCLRAPTHQARFLQACRQAVSDGIIIFSKTYFQNNPSPICEITGEFLTPHTSHVDHAPPNTFRYIAWRFTQKYRIDVERVILTSGGDNSHKVFMPPELEAQWVSFHWDLAKLRVISASENLRRGTHGVELSEPIEDVSQWVKDWIHDDMAKEGWVLR